MTTNIAGLGAPKNIGLVAHDHKKADLTEWARFNRDLLAAHTLYATGTTGAMLERELDIPVEKLKSGPLGGDQQLGAMIAEGDIDLLVFFWDPLEPLPHEPDVKALLRIAVVWNIPVACNRATADFLISSPLMGSEYQRHLPDYDGYLRRRETKQSRTSGTNAPAPRGDAVVPLRPRRHPATTPDGGTAGSG